MTEHWEMNEFFHKGYIRIRNSNRRNTIVEECILFPAPNDRNIAVNRILVMDYVLTAPLMFY